MREDDLTKGSKDDSLKDLHNRLVAALNHTVTLEAIFLQNQKYLENYLKKAQSNGTWNKTQSSCLESLVKIVPSAKNFLTPSYRAEAKAESSPPTRPKL